MHALKMETSSAVQVHKFMSMYGDLDLVPVKVVIPLIFSLRIMVNFKHICVWGEHTKEACAIRAKAPEDMRTCPPAEFFRPPPGYVEMSLEEKTAESKQRRKQQAGRAEASSSSPSNNDASQKEEEEMMAALAAGPGAL